MGSVATALKSPLDYQKINLLQAGNTTSQHVHQLLSCHDQDSITTDSHMPAPLIDLVLGKAPNMCLKLLNAVGSLKDTCMQCSHRGRFIRTPYILDCDSGRPRFIAQW